MRRSADWRRRPMAAAGSLVIADLAQQTRDEHLKLTLLDSGSTRRPRDVVRRLLTLLESDLPWTISLTDRAGTFRAARTRGYLTLTPS